MKKLMILAATAAMAIAASAASATWGFSSPEITDRNGSYIGENIAATAFLYLGAANTTASTIDLTGLTLLATSGQDGTTFTFGPLNAPVELSGLASDAKGQDYTMILVEGDGLTALTENNSYQMVVATGTSGQAVDPMSGVTWATFVNGTDYGASSWANLKVVPEPTSGLLMLLGMAGLALRRRRA